MSSKKYGILASVVDELCAGRDDVARRLLSHLLEECGPNGPAEDIQYFIFASALAKRLSWERHEEINLYLRQFGETQISLFNLVAQHLPTVALAGRVGNEVLAGFMAGQEVVTLLDLGIGSGRQEVELLRLLAARGELPRMLNVIAVEPDAGSLIQSGSDLAVAADEVGLPLDFTPVHKLVEELDSGDWAWFASFPGPLVVNAAFALHHVRDGEGDRARDDLFRRLRSAGAQVVVLCEPNSDHFTSSLRERFDNAWHHFGTTFRLIDSLGLPREETAAMKVFFSREIEDILGSHEDTRYERHEPLESWMSRMRDAGFAPAADLTGVSPAEGLVRVVPRTGYVGLDYHDETLVAILCATADVPARTKVAEPELAAVRAG
jgi:hypothetical protein